MNEGRKNFAVGFLAYGNSHFRTSELLTFCVIMR